MSAAAASERGPGELTDAVAEVVRWLFDPGDPGGSALLEPEVERAARLLLLDTLGCTIGGGTKPELRALNASLADLEPGPLSIPGMAAPLAAPALAYWSAMAATWDEACEGLARAHGRPGLHAFPVAVALALAHDHALDTTLVALVRGYELGGRLGERLRIGTGMHVDGTWGTFGAVAAAGSSLRHDAETVMATIEAAACQTPMSLYLPVAQGATIRNSYVAEAARRAIGLATSVAAGVTTPTGALDAVERLAFDAGDGRAAVAAPGEWLITQGYLKPFAAVRHVHYGAEAALRWRDRGHPSDTIEAISLDVYPEAVTYCGNRAPTTAIAAQFSLTHGVARVLATGDLGPDAYADASLQDPEVRRLEQLIDVRSAVGATPDQRYATLRIVTATGHVDEVHVEHVAGDAEHPMTADAVAAKFTAASQGLGATWSAAAVVDAVLAGPLDAPLASAIGATSPTG